jgi:hypothetical protein
MNSYVVMAVREMAMAMREVQQPESQISINGLKEEKFRRGTFVALN